MTMQIVCTDGLMAVGFLNQSHTNILSKFYKTMIDFPAPRLSACWRTKTKVHRIESMKAMRSVVLEPPPTLLDIRGLMYDVNTNVVTTQTDSNQQTRRNGTQ